MSITQAQSSMMTRKRFKDGPVHDLKLNLISDRKINGRIYNIPTVSEVVALYC